MTELASESSTAPAPQTNPTPSPEPQSQHKATQQFSVVEDSGVKAAEEKLSGPQAEINRKKTQLSYVGTDEEYEKRVTELPKQMRVVLLACNKHVMTTCYKQHLRFEQCKAQNKLDCSQYAQKLRLCTAKVIGQVSEECTDQLQTYCDCLDTHGLDTKMCAKESSQFVRSCPPVDHALQKKALLDQQYNPIARARIFINQWLSDTIDKMDEPPKPAKEPPSQSA